MAFHLSVRRGACAPAVALALAAVARAAEPAIGTEPAPAAPQVELPEVVVRLPRSEAAADPTAAATVIAADAYAGEAKQVAELVATAPGVAVSDYGGLGQLATVSIRGSTADGVLVLLDGLPLNTAFGGGVDLSTIPRQWISRIEVVRGAEGARYGSGALGGVVDVITRRPQAGLWSAEASAGSFGTASLGANGAADVRGWSVLGSASADVTEGDYPFDYRQAQNVAAPAEQLVREHNAARRAAGLVKAAGALGALRLDALAELSGGRRDIPASLDGSSSPGLQEDARALGMVRLSGLAPAPNLSASARLHARLDRLDVTLGPDATRQRGGTAGAQAQLVHAHGPGVLTGAVEADGDVLDATGVAGTRTRATVSASLAEDLLLAGGRARLAPALRVDRVGPFAGWSAKLGGSWRLGGDLVARASAGRSFRAPSFAELYLRQGIVRPNPDLVPEEGLGADASLTADGAAGLASVGAYATRYRDLVIYDLASLGTLLPRNVGEALVSGVEVQAALAPVRALAGASLSAAYTLLVSENLRAPAQELGKWLPHRARHRAYARAGVAPGPAAAHVELQYVGRQYLDARNVLPIAPALVWNAGASVRIPARLPLALGLELRNLLDDRSLQDAIGNPLPGRMVMVTLRAGASATQEGTP